MKKYINSIVLILTIGILFPQNLESFTQKITLENSLRDKIYSELEKTLDKNQDRFVVIVNLELGRYNDLLNDKSKSTSNLNNRGMEYLPGVPLSGSKGISNNNQSAPSRRMGANDYIINEIEIEVWIEPSLANGANEKMIESLIKGIIPQTSQCDDCITIETMNFNNKKNTEDSEIEKLRKELNDMKDQARKDQMIELNLQLADLKAQLEDSENELQTWAIYLSTKDSVRLAFLENDREQSFQKNQEKVDDLTAQVIAEKDAQINSQTGGNDLEGGGSGGMINWMVGGGIFLLALSAIAFLMILINKKSVVYLKPKGPDNNNAFDAAKNNGTDESSDTKTSATSQSVYPGSTSANIDESVLSSELKALRQSSIAMSASQKEGATQIIKDWMDDGSSKDADNAETEGGE